MIKHFANILDDVIIWKLNQSAKGGPDDMSIKINEQII